MRTVRPMSLPPWGRGVEQDGFVIAAEVSSGPAAVEAVQRLSPDLMAEFRERDGRATRPQGPLAKLTSREWETLELMRQGLSTADIATKLFVTPVTVRSHVSAILRKLHVADRKAAAHIAESSTNRRA